jgi:hypothetical protein
MCVLPGIYSPVIMIMPDCALILNSIVERPLEIQPIEVNPCRYYVLHGQWMGNIWHWECIMDTSPFVIKVVLNRYYLTRF